MRRTSSVTIRPRVALYSGETHQTCQHTYTRRARSPQGGNLPMPMSMSLSVSLRHAARRRDQMNHGWNKRVTVVPSPDILFLTKYDDLWISESNQRQQPSGSPQDFTRPAKGKETVHVGPADSVIIIFFKKAYIIVVGMSPPPPPAGLSDASPPRHVNSLLEQA